MLGVDFSIKFCRSIHDNLYIAHNCPVQTDDTILLSACVLVKTFEQLFAQRQFKVYKPFVQISPEHYMRLFEADLFPDFAKGRTEETYVTA